MSWIDRKGKRYLTQEDVEQAKMLADVFYERISPRLKEDVERGIEQGLSKIKPAEGPSDLKAVATMIKDNLREDVKRLCSLPPSSLKVFYCLFENGPSSIFRIRELISMPRRTIHFALKRLKAAGLVNKDKHGSWAVTAKGFSSFA